MLKLIATILLVYGAYSLYLAISGQGYLVVVGGLLALVAGTGLWLRKAWSQYFLYVISLVIVGEWTWIVWASVSRNGWPYDTTLKNFIGLIPGLCIVAFAVGSCIFAFRTFRGAATPSA